MPPKRTNSGTREGGTALIHTLESIKSKPDRTAAVFNARFKQNYLTDYPGATDAEIQTARDSNIAWLGGRQLGSNITEVLKNVDGAKQAVIRRVENKANEPTRVLERTKVIDDMEEGKARIFKDAGDDLAKKGDQVLKIFKRKPRTDEDRAKQQQQVSKLEIKNLELETKNALKTFQDNTAVKKSRENAINIIQNAVKGRKGRSEVANLKLTKKQLLDEIARLKGQLKDETPARDEITREEEVTNKAMKEYMKTLVDKTTENEEASKARPKPSPKPWGRGAPPPVPPPGIFPIQQKELEEDHKEENQLKKITRRNVAKIDDSVKVKPSSTVKPTIEASDIRQALAKSNNRRFKIGTNVIKYHRLNGIGKTATQFL